MIWTSGHTMKFAFRVGRYISRSLCDTARLPPPSAMVMTVKKVAIPKETLAMLRVPGRQGNTNPLAQKPVDQTPPSLTLPLNQNSL